MLDLALEAAYEAEKKNTARQEMVDAFMHFPEDELKKIASGELKLAYGDDDDWLKKFEDTPLYDQALALEEASLEIDIADQQQRISENEERQAKNQQRDAIWDQKDALRLKKRMLELELRKGQLGGGAEEEEGEEEEEAPEVEESEGEAPEKLSSAAAYFYRQRQRVLDHMAGQMRKQAASDEALSRLALGLPATLAAAAPEGQRLEAFGEGLKHTSGQGLKGMGLGALGGAALGAGAGLLARQPVGLSALGGGVLGGGLGGIAGGIKGHVDSAGTELLRKYQAMNEAKTASADAAGRVMAKEAMVKVAHSALEKVASGRSDELTDLEWYTVDEMAKAAQARLAAGVPFGDLADFEKVAINVGALWKGIKGGLGGAKDFLGQAGQAVGRSYSRAASAAGGGAGGLRAGLGAGAARAKDWAGTGLGKATQWAAANPGSAAAIGGAGLVGAGGLGFAHGRLGAN